MIDIRDITPGKSYACKYRDLTGEPALAILLTRDTEQQLVRVRDIESGHEMTLPYSDIWDVDTVEWRD